MSFCDEKITSIDSSEEIENSNSIELIRKCAQLDSINTSWDNSYHGVYNAQNENNKTPPFVSIMITDDNSPSANVTTSSTQTEQFVTLPINCSIVNRFEVLDGQKGPGGHKRVICPTSSTSDLTESEGKLLLERSLSLSLLSSNSETSFKSINSNTSYKVRKRRMKSDSNLFRDALQQSRKSHNLKQNYSENSTPGGTPRKERNHLRNIKTKASKLFDFCTWIGKKGFQSITGLNNEHREPFTACEATNESPIEEIKKLRMYMEKVDEKQAQLERENDILKENMQKMMTKMEELESKLRCQTIQPTPCVPPPPPPPPPPPATKLMQSNTIPCRGSAPPRVAAPRLTITPQDIANVKLRKAKDNPVRTKSATQQPLVTQQMLQSTRTKLRRARPVATSTPKQQLSELEKCLLQEPMVTSLYRHRVARAAFRSAENLRPRPLPALATISSPQLSPLKFPNSALPT